MPLVEKRYAEALVDLAVAEDSLDGFQVELSAVVDAFRDQDRFRNFLLDPEVRSETKKDALGRMFGGNLGQGTVNFLMLLVDKGRIGFLPGIMKQFIILADKLRHVLHMTVASSEPLDTVTIKALEDKYRTLYGASSVRVDTVVDKSLMGGVKVTIGDRVVDGSVKGRLESLREALIRN